MLADIRRLEACAAQKWICGLQKQRVAQSPPAGGLCLSLTT